MFLLFWGCPALQAGRAISQLAVRSALRFFATLKSWVWPSATAAYPSACGPYGPVDRKITWT